MERYIEFEGNITNDLNLESVIEPIFKLPSVVCVAEGLNWDSNKGKAYVKVRGDFDPCAIDSIITNASYVITKIGKKEFD